MNRQCVPGTTSRVVAQSRANAVRLRHRVPVVGLKPGDLFCEGSEDVIFGRLMRVAEVKCDSSGEVIGIVIGEPTD